MAYDEDTGQKYSRRDDYDEWMRFLVKIHIKVFSCIIS
jgi:hypothetical protein